MMNVINLFCGAGDTKKVHLIVRWDRNFVRTCNKERFDEENNRLHFDINHYNFILWEGHADLREKLVN